MSLPVCRIEVPNGGGLKVVEGKCTGPFHQGHVFWATGNRSFEWGLWDGTACEEKAESWRNDWKYHSYLVLESFTGIQKLCNVKNPNGGFVEFTAMNYDPAVVAIGQGELLGRVITRPPDDDSGGVFFVPSIILAASLISALVGAFFGEWIRGKLGLFGAWIRGKLTT